MDKILATFNGEANFLFFIEKALPVDQTEEGDGYQIVGVASTPTIDHDFERMALPALKRMARQITYEGVPLRVEHQKGDNAVIGKINEAWVDDANKLWIKAILTKGNIVANQLHQALKNGAKLGLSVGGRVKQAVREMSEHQGKMIKTFFDVILDEVSVTPRPSNYDAWLINKHYVSDGDNTEVLFNTPLHNSFLLENPKFDYLMAIEKSIPSEAWTKVENNNDILKNMEYVTKKDFDSYSKGVLNILRKFTETEATGTTREADAPEAMTTEARDQDNSTETKDENEAQVRTVKDQSDLSEEEDSTSSKEEDSTKVGKTGANGSDEHGQREKKPAPEMASRPHDQDNSDETKDENPAQLRMIKSMIDRLALRMKKTSSSETAPVQEVHVHGPEHSSSTEKELELGDENETSKNQTEDTETDTEKETSDSYEKDSSSEDEQSDERDSSSEDEQSDSSSEEADMKDYELPEIRRSRPALDAYSATIGQFIDHAEQRMQKGGKRIPGLRRTIIDFVRQDPAIQKDIRQMLRLPGIKKSVVGGYPVTYTKDGARLKLVPDDTYVQKSVVNKNAKFGDVYKANFSSIQDQGMQQY
jgi:hypothetical protein